MEIVKRTEEGAVFLRPRTRRLDDVTAAQLKEALSAEQSNGARVIVLNLSDVEFLDSSALGVMIAGLRRLQGRREILLCGVQDSVLGLLRLTGLVRIFPCFATEEEALASASGRPV